MTTDAKDKPQDVVPPEAGGDSKEQGPKDSSPKTYTEEEVELKFSSQRSVLDAKVAKLEKQGESATKRADAAEEVLAQERKERQEAEIEAARDDPDALTATQKRHKEAERKAKLDKREREVEEKDAKADEKLEKVTKSEIKERAEQVALKHTVDADTLLKHTDGSLEAMEDLAKSLPTKEEKPPLKPDSSTTTGGGAMPESAHGKIRAGWDELHK